MELTARLQLVSRGRYGAHLLHEQGDRQFPAARHR